MRSILRATAALGIVYALTAPPSLSAAPTAKPSPNPSASALRNLHALEHKVFEASAPGDAYFGRLKMSYLGINNVFKDASVRAGEHTVDPDVINKLKDADAALQAWVAQYPRDPQLSRSYFLATAAYKKVWTKEYQDKAWRYMHTIVQRFSQTYFGKQVKKDLAIGFTEHYYAQAAPCALATPASTAAPEPTAAATSKPSKRGSKATPAPTPEPTPAATEPPSPSPIATVKPAPGEAKVEVLTPPCAEAAPPSASPTVQASSPLPSAGPEVPSGAVSPAPIPSPSATRAS
ncbi:MAG: hypothetical protein M3R53_05535 [Candidatus Eremiobacteraeota bacterium]|nr:hypothetical protein [Candidatus Eremiobacteraeota bacterium]